MAYDFWAVANSIEFQNKAAAQGPATGSFVNFTQTGEYLLTIRNAEMRPTQAGYQKLTLRVQADSGETGFWDLLVGHGGGQSQTAEIAQRNLALILKYSGARAANPQGLIGLRVKVWVKMKPDSKGVDRPEFRPIGPANGAAKPAAPATATMAATAAVTAAARPAGRPISSLPVSHVQPAPALAADEELEEAPVVKPAAASDDFSDIPF